MWLLYSFGAAFFAGITAILAKIGVKTTPSSMATALRTIVVLIFAWLMVMLVGSANTIGDISSKSWVFLVLSGLATGGSWLCFFRALQLGPVAQVSVIDKSSIVLTVLLAIILLGETDSLLFRLLGIVLIAIGTFMMIEKQPPEKTNPAAQVRRQPSWILYALGAAIFAALTAIFGKVGIEDVESNLGTFIRTVVVLVMAWIVVIIKKEWVPLRSVSGKEMLFLVLSGLATGASWLCYWRAMQDGPASVVAPIDKLSVLVTVAFAWVLFGERQSKKALTGLGVLTAGTLVMVIGA